MSTEEGVYCREHVQERVTGRGRWGPTPAADSPPCPPPCKPSDPRHGVPLAHRGLSTKAEMTGGQGHRRPRCCRCPPLRHALINTDRKERETSDSHLSLSLPPPPHTHVPTPRPSRTTEGKWTAYQTPTRSPRVHWRGNNKTTRCDSALLGVRQGRGGPRWGGRACALAIWDFREVLGSLTELYRSGIGQGS